ncbi:unnamed protein product [Ceutorhynchus assimilis]|uniref:Regulatory protein zeste n=1 Tax=Ceutorhynchus assimilis TaxID=467358 RepID=A0A9N9N1P5_9CUCU|nr:unnamed protein product [Ceutorhynchus assimilis]
MAFKINDGRWQVLLGFMDRNPLFARGQFAGPNGKVIQRKLWEQLSSELNSLGSGSKSVEKWQKSDIKYGIKRKAAMNKLSLDETGGGPGNYKKLNDYEQRILSILGKSFYEGVGSKECGGRSQREVIALDNDKAEDTQRGVPNERYLHWGDLIPEGLFQREHMEIASGDKGLPSTSTSQDNMEIPKLELTIKNNEIAGCCNSKQAQREFGIVPNTEDYYTDHTPRKKPKILTSHDCKEIPNDELKVRDNEIAGCSKFLSKLAQRESAIVPNTDHYYYSDHTPTKKLQSILTSHESDNEISGCSKQSQRESTIVPNIGDHNHTDKTPRKKKKLDREEIEDGLLTESINELKSIKEGVFAIGTNLSLINDTLQEIKTILGKE